VVIRKEFAIWIRISHQERVNTVVPLRDRPIGRRKVDVGVREERTPMPANFGAHAKFQANYRRKSVRKVFRFGSHGSAIYLIVANFLWRLYYIIETLAPE
jgi:hypothetical protein